MRIRNLLSLLLSLFLLCTVCVSAVADTAPLSVSSTDNLQLVAGIFTMDELLKQSENPETRSACISALLRECSGVKVTCEWGADLWEDTTCSHSLRTLSCGKVVRLLGIEDGWFHVIFGRDIGYLKVSCAQTVRYGDYLDTDAVIDPREALLSAALSWLGTPYRYGGSGRGGTDCSGFTMAIFAKLGYNLPHGAADQYAMCQKVTTQERAPGDLVFFNLYGGISHVGIYLGSGMFIHASTSSGVVIDSLCNSYYANSYVGAGRILSDS